MTRCRCQAFPCPHTPREPGEPYYGVCDFDGRHGAVIDARTAEDGYDPVCANVRDAEAYPLTWRRDRSIH